MVQHSTFGIAAAVLALVIVSPAFSHDSWISRGGFRNTVGEWCCGEGDCEALPPDSVTMTSTGYRLTNGEFVPMSEAQPSPDGSYWRCKRPDGSRRCFFAPPPGT
jgi:hypothetical protein